MAYVEMSSKKGILGFFPLVMINVIAVASIRSLPFSAAYGFSLVFFYILAAIFFFIPSMLVAAELGTGWPNTGGIYVWVREAFGKRWSFIVIWLNWIYNVVWYPTIIALLAGTIAYFFNPDLASNNLYMGCSVLVLFWLATWFNLHGMKISSWISTLGALLGTLLPMLFIIFLGMQWWKSGRQLAFTFSWDNFFPSQGASSNLAFLTNVLFGLVGMEMSATHAADMKNPKRDYPRSLIVSAVVILLATVFASLSIAMVIPSGQLNLAVGAMQAFSIFLQALHLDWLVKVMAACILIGGISAVSAWIIGPTKGLMVASKDGSLPAFFAKTNKNGVPKNILISQAILVSLLSLFFVVFPTVNNSFWFLSAIAAQLALIVYIFLFLSALKLHFHKPEVARSFKVPGKNLGIYLTCLSGIASSFFVIILGFIPPSQVDIKNVLFYECLLVGGILVFCIIPVIIIRLNKRYRRA